MAATSPKEYLYLLYMALSSPIGIEVPTSDITKLRAKLYAARAEAKDLSLSCLQFRAAPSGQSIYIVKGNSEEKD